MKAARYAFIENVLFRKSFSGPYLRCLIPSEAEWTLKELHEGTCDNHSGGRSLAHKAITQGYFWPYMAREAEQFVRKCDKCQKHAPMIRRPAEELSPIVGPWPFARWGMDIVGPLPTAPGGKKYVLLATDYFTKWVEAEAYGTVAQADVIKFVWRNIICRFGIPRAIISDNGTQFNNRKFRKYCMEKGIIQQFSSRSYPQGNGQVEKTNRTIFDCLKKKLEQRKGKWFEELPNVLWAYRTTRRKPTGESPFSLAYGSEAVIPTEIELPTIRTMVVDGKDNDQQIAHNLDLVEEHREVAALRLANYQNQVANYFNKRINPRRFKVGEWVLRKVMENTKDLNAGKFGRSWEGPFEVTEAYGKCAYKLRRVETAVFKLIIKIHADRNTTPRLPILWGQSIGSMPISTSSRDPCRSQHYPEVTNPLGAVNWIHADLNIIQRSPILWEQSVRSMPIATLPRGYQSSGGSQLDPCRSQHHPEVNNPLGVINKILANHNTTPRLSIL
ncbi:unnamed protein product [Prunus brigantina]